MSLEGNSTFTENEGEINLNKCLRVKACIDSYLSKHPRLTLINVEDKTTVSHTTLRRIVSGKGNPQAEAVIKIYRGLGFDLELYQYMLDFHPDIANLMRVDDRGRENSFVSNDEAKYFTDESTYHIMSMAYSHAGISEDDIKLHFGLNGLQKLHELLSKGILKRHENGRIFGLKENYRLSYSDTLEATKLSLNFYRIAEAGRGINHINHQTDSLNLLGIKALMVTEKEQAKYRSENIFSNPLYFGDIHVFHTSVSSTYMAYTDEVEIKQ